VQVGNQLADDYADGVWYVDLAPIADPDLVPVTAARALHLTHVYTKLGLSSRVRLAQEAARHA
jgi:predicted ATPase